MFMFLYQYSSFNKSSGYGSMLDGIRIGSWLVGGSFLKCNEYRYWGSNSIWWESICLGFDFC